MFSICNCPIFSYFCPVREAPPISNFRHVFQTKDQLKVEFVKFLKTIFYQLDESIVLKEMERILADPNKTDEQIYKELVSEIGNMKKRFASLWQLWSLRVLKTGLGKQVAEVFKSFNKKAFQNYMEIYDRRYLNVIRKMASLPLSGDIFAVSNDSKVNFSDRIQAGAIFSTYPYKKHVPLNDPDCKDPFKQPHKTHKPIENEVANESVDLIACLGGLHHIPKDRVDPFVQSMQTKLKPGGVILLREHNIGEKVSAYGLTKQDLRGITALVHTFVNAESGISWEVESKEVREFKSIDEWTKIMENHQFTKISSSPLVLKDDPTENGIVAFIKKPKNLEALKQATQYLINYARPVDGSWGTWIEWGNVRYSKQYAKFIQNHHAYAFDNIGHLKQHWKYFSQYIKESRKSGMSIKKIIFSENFSMNTFIFLTTAVQCISNHILNTPQRLAAKWKYGEDWRNVSNLSNLEKYNAKVEKEYSNFIDHTPFYMFDYLGKIKGLWETVFTSKENWLVIGSSIIQGVAQTAALLSSSLISMPIRVFYTSEANQEPDTIKLIIRDPKNELEKIKQRWEKEKDPKIHKNHNVETVLTSEDGHKIVSFPRYRPLTKLLGYLTDTSSLEVIEIGGQKEISVDVLLKENMKTPVIEKTRLVYEMEKLQDSEKERYATYITPVFALKDFQKQVGVQNVEYIHE